MRHVQATNLGGGCDVQLAPTVSSSVGGKEQNDHSRLSRSVRRGVGLEIPDQIRSEKIQLRLQSSQSFVVSLHAFESEK